MVRWPVVLAALLMLSACDQPYQPRHAHCPPTRPHRVVVNLPLGRAVEPVKPPPPVSPSSEHEPTNDEKTAAARSASDERRRAYCGMRPNLMWCRNQGELP
jgi:hypothetical protein